MDGPVKHLVNDNVLAVGDAGGLVMASNGGGIAQAMMSGYYAAESTISHLKEGRPLQSYHQRVMDVMRKPLKISLRTKRLAYLILSRNWTTEMALRFLGPIGGIQRAVECHRPTWVI